MAATRALQLCEWPVASRCSRKPCLPEVTLPEWETLLAGSSQDESQVVS